MAMAARRRGPGARRRTPDPPAPRLPQRIRQMGTARGVGRHGDGAGARAQRSDVAPFLRRNGRSSRRDRVASSAAPVDPHGGGYPTKDVFASRRIARDRRQGVSGVGATRLRQRPDRLGPATRHRLAVPVIRILIFAFRSPNVATLFHVPGAGSNLAPLETRGSPTNLARRSSLVIRHSTVRSSAQLDLEPAAFAAALERFQQCHLHGMPGHAFKHMLHVSDRAEAIRAGESLRAGFHERAEAITVGDLQAAGILDIAEIDHVAFAVNDLLTVDSPDPADKRIDTWRGGGVLHGSLVAGAAIRAHDPFTGLRIEVRIENVEEPFRPGLAKCDALFGR